MELSEEEREDLVRYVADLAERNVLDKRDYVNILEVCRAACERVGKEIDEILKPGGPVQ